MPNGQARHPVPQEHPYLLGSRAELQQLAWQRSADYQRMRSVARAVKGDDYAVMISQALVAAIEEDAVPARQVQRRAMKFVHGPVRKGHTPFAVDLALCGLAARAVVNDTTVQLELGTTQLTFQIERVGGAITLHGQTSPFP